MVVSNSGDLVFVVSLIRFSLTIYQLVGLFWLLVDWRRDFSQWLLEAV